jgi:hypothetical protein
MWLLTVMSIIGVVVAASQDKPNIGRAQGSKRTSNEARVGSDG